MFMCINVIYLNSIFINLSGNITSKLMKNNLTIIQKV